MDELDHHGMDSRSPTHRRCRRKGEPLPLSSRLEDVEPPTSRGTRAAEQHARHLLVNTRRRLRRTEQIATATPDAKVQTPPLHSPRRHLQEVE
jgi:hypothetical protein